MQGFHVGVCEQVMCWKVHEFLCGQDTIFICIVIQTKSKASTNNVALILKVSR